MRPLDRSPELPSLPSLPLSPPKAQLHTMQIHAYHHIHRFDVVKTRLQAGSASGTTMQVMRAVVRAEGWRALFSGWTAAVARAFPANAGLFAGVELASRLMGSSG